MNNLYNETLLILRITPCHCFRHFQEKKLLMFSPFSSLSSFSFFSVCEKTKNTSVIGHMNNIRPSQASMHRDNDSFIKINIKSHKCTDHIPQTATPNKNKVMPSFSHFLSDSPKENFDAFQFL